MARRRITRAVAVVLVVLTVVGAGPAVGAPDGALAAESRWAGLLDAQPALLAELTAAEARLAAAERRARDAVLDLGWIHDAVAESELRVGLAAAERDRTSARRNGAVRGLLRARQYLEGYRSRMDEHAATIYKHGPPALGPIESLLRSGSPGAYVVHQRLTEAVLLEDDAAVRRSAVAFERAHTTLGEASVRAALARAAWEHERDELDRLRALVSLQASHVAAAQGAVGPLRRARDAARAAESLGTASMVALEHEIGADDPSRRDALAARRLAAHADAVAAAAEEHPFLGRPPRPRPATMPAVSGYRCPVDGGRFTNDWAFPRSGGRSHEGTDVFAEQGSPVLAVAAGVVAKLDRHDTHGAGELSGDLGGRSVTIETDVGERWYYAHLDDVADGLEPGLTVAAGQQLGTLGDSGNARGGAPHLHLGRTWQGSPVNPYPSLVVACG